MPHSLYSPRGGAIRLGAIVILFAHASAFAQVSSYSATATGWTSLFGAPAINDPSAQDPFAFTQVDLPGGGKQITGSGFSAAAPIGQPFTDYAAGDGIAFAKPGSLGARVDGLSFAEVYSPLVRASFGAVMTEYIPITNAGLPNGSPVSFNASYHLDGFTSSDRFGSGPYRNGPEFSPSTYNTGSFYFQFLAYTIDGASLAYQNDAVGSGTYSFPNSLFQSIPTALDFGASFPMNGKVGDYLVLYTVLGLAVDDRGDPSSRLIRQSHLDFSNTIDTFADPVTPGTTFIANDHNYSSTVPAPGAVVVMACSAFGFVRRRRAAR